MNDSSFSSDRRDFLTGKSAIGRVRAGVEGIADLRGAPTSGHTVRLTQRAMACDFSVIMNAGIPKSRIQDASHVLDLISDLEQQMSVYRDDSEMTELNQLADERDVVVEPGLFRLLVEARRIGEVTGGAFDPTSGPLVALWRACREASRIPTQDEIDRCREIVGMHHVQFNEQARTIRYDQPGVELNLGAIGKGYALDCSAEALAPRGIKEFLLHGGHSSLLARGDHNGTGGWPVGIGNPLFTGKRLGTIVIRDEAMATSGSNIQYFRHKGKKYGHILDPRTGWPIETMLSVTVLAPDAALADALSTAFYVMGPEEVSAIVDQIDGVSAVLIPFPEGRTLRPVVLGVPENRLFLDHGQIEGAAD